MGAQDRLIIHNTRIEAEKKKESDHGFASRLRQRRDEIGINQEGLAQLIGRSRSSVQNYETGRIPSGSALIDLCRVLGVSADWLLFGGQTREVSIPDDSASSGESDARNGGDEKPQLVIPAAVEPETDYYAMVPLAEAHLSAGGGAFVPSENAVKLLAFRKDWLNNYATGLKNVVLMLVHGNSMSPTLENGDLVMIDHGRRIIHDGGLYAIRIDRTIAVKRLELLVTGHVRIISDNREEYGLSEVPVQDLVVLGRIIWYARELL
jgi:phage repressor protein C with HTH and peptisase S24 domain